MRLFSLILVLLLPMSAQAWWNDAWEYRKELAVDASPAGGDLTTALTNPVVLVRLHTGNFGYFLDMMPQGEDLRFVAGDDLTPLKYRIEKFDPINELALVWVQLPTLNPGSKNTFWMYYGNGQAVAASDDAGIFDPAQVLAYAFNEAGTSPVDLTSYNTAPAAFTAQPLAAALAGSGAQFTGSESLQVAASPVLAIDPANGWTWSAWVKIDQAQESAVLLDATDGASRVWIEIEGTSLQAQLSDAAGNVVVTPAGPILTPGNWQHVALVLDTTGMALFLDGSEAARIDTVYSAFTPALTVGASAVSTQGLVGSIDELRVANTTRSADWLKLAASNGQAINMLVYGEDGQQEGSGGDGEEGYLAITMRNVTVDGWVVIVFLAMMGAVSWVVMASKGMVVSRVRRDNAEFINHFKDLGSQNVAELDQPDAEADDEARESPLLLALGGKHDHFQSSTLYRVYHSGVHEMESRMPKAVGAQASDMDLSPQAIDAIRAAMDATLVREGQKLNSQMVLLTIAISGGPFLGLLGTVVGVMITFAAIAAAGDVNVNAIAPGIAAALLATVAGLAVAIPALFGYNYLGTRIKEITADMHVFVDEFVTKIAEQHS